ncbi:MAG TPA: hypothetical protein DHV48_12680 [Prolixibacteraceae bacterium]|nr:hypothetical protein [Prolixibacteraceae bacterium]
MLKKIIPRVMFVLLFGLIIIGFALKESMNNYLSKMMKAQAGSEIIHSGSAFVDSTFNYTKNGKSYQPIPFERLKLRPEIRLCANCIKH